MNARETYFNKLDDVAVHYDRLDGKAYGTRGAPYDFYCTSKLKDTLNVCFRSLFDVWPYGKPEIILSAGTIGDNENQHGKGLAFDLDGFHFSSSSFMMNEYSGRSLDYTGVNAHLFLYFPQVLSYHYPNHHDHFHVDFNRSMAYNTASNAQTFFLQTALINVFDHDLGTFGVFGDGVDGIYGDMTRKATLKTLKVLGLDSRGGLTNSIVWKEFLISVRNQCFHKVNYA